VLVDCMITAWEALGLLFRVWTYVGAFRELEPLSKSSFGFIRALVGFKPLYRVEEYVIYQDIRCRGSHVFPFRPLLETTRRKS
jgi:hypothetical protein